MAEKMKWTAEQERVIGSRRQSLLVSAAAGSGKTAVLVQRILDQVLDPDDPRDIDRMLIVTFTNAAADQLRERIRRKLDEAARSDDRRMAETASGQIARMSGDHIETIDRFCREVVLDHADQLQIDPSFRIGDRGELSLLKADAAAQTIEEAYASPDEGFREDFLVFSELYAPGRTDRKLEDMILQFYEYSMSHAFPRIWRRWCADQYRGEDGRSAWMESLVSTLHMQMHDIRIRLEEALEVCLAQDGPYCYADAVTDHIRLFRSLEGCGSIGEYGQILSGYSWPKPGSARRGKGAPFIDPVLREYVKKIRSDAEKKLKEINRSLFPHGEEEIRSMQLMTARSMDVLCRLTDHFEDVFSQMKTERNVADFSDVSHHALRVLVRTGEDGAPLTDEDGRYVPTEAAQEYAEYYQEIYIDEYQDSNPVQEALLSSIAGGGKGLHNRFMVGDVKQSIYRFRMADPQIFMRKAAVWPDDEAAPERRIDLHSNFRSSAPVIDAVNLVFRQIMRREIGGIEYDDTEMLFAARSFPADPEEGPADPQSVEPDPARGQEDPELILVQKGNVPGAGNRIEAEAETVAARIGEIVGKLRICGAEGEAYRPARYGDIAILLRSAAGWAETFSRVLSAHGIPCRAGSRTGYFDAPEIRTMLSYLHVLDNPMQDIPLAASLRSGIGHITDRELSAIRTQYPGTSLWQSIVSYARDGKEEQLRAKTAQFIAMTGHLRSQVRDTPIHMLLWQIYDETGFADAILASKGGLQKRANLDLLVDRAIDYEATSYRGLFHFIRYIEKLRQSETDFGEAAPGGAQEDMVRIMTMHAAKGLEFPVVFVSGLGKQFNLTDARSPLVLHDRLGAGLDYVDPELRIRHPNRIRSAIRDRILADTVGEELRILYVAMTRAEEKLILTGCTKDTRDYLQKLSHCRAWTEEKLAGTDVLGAHSMLDWVVMALMRHDPEGDFFDRETWELPENQSAAVSGLPGRVRVQTESDIALEAAAGTVQDRSRILALASAGAEESYDAQFRSRLQEQMTPVPFPPGSAVTPGKVSVSELKHEGYAAEMAKLLEFPGEDGVILYGAPGTEVPEGHEAPEAQEVPEGHEAPEAREVPVPRFMREEGADTLTGTDRGTAYHEVLAAAELWEEPYPDSIPALLETMVKCDRIQKEAARGIDPARIGRFLDTDLAHRMRLAAKRGQLYREQPFVIGRKGNEIRADWSADETVLIQGIIDAFFVEGEHVILVDYKSDRARPGDEDSLTARYRTQFELYRDALEMLLRRKVTEAWLYSLSLGKAIPVMPD